MGTPISPLRGNWIPLSSQAARGLDLLIGGASLSGTWISIHQEASSKSTACVHVDIATRLDLSMHEIASNLTFYRPD